MTDQQAARRTTAVTIVAILGAALLAIVVYFLYFPQQRQEREASPVSLPSDNPFAGNWATVDAFPGLTFDRPLTIIQAGPEIYLVAEQQGLVRRVTAGERPRAETFLDLTSKVVARGEAGLVGLTVHPGFGTALTPEGRYVYVFYVTEVEGKLYDRLSRFETDSTGSRADPLSEVILIDQLDEDTDHNAGQLQFGPDSFLYIAIGDEGGVADEFGNAQHIDKDLFSGILRIDVECQPTRSHPIRQQPQTGRTKGYCIPNDNPLVGRSGVLEEFWAIGFRNPWRFSFDTTGDLWGADVGQDRHEEIFRATSGSNHQWSYGEGTASFAESPLKGQRPDPLVGQEALPVFTYPHTNGNGAVVGGYVYRGSQFPELNGKYIFGDFNSGRVWSLELPALTGVAGVPKLETVLQLPADRRLVAFGRDRNGELFLCVFGERASILRLRRAS